MIGLNIALTGVSIFIFMWILMSVVYSDVPSENVKRAEKVFYGAAILLCWLAALVGVILAIWGV